jgi:hypothetical protein
VLDQKEGDVISRRDWGLFPLPNAI